MKPQDEFEWTDDERHLLAALEREREPDPDLEDRTVALLRSQGLIRDSALMEDSANSAAVIPFRARSLPRTMTAGRWGWAAAAAACVVAVFLAGVVVGERRAVRSTVEILAEVHGDELRQASARVQQTGSAYVSALTALGQLAATTEDSSDLSQGREVALAALYSAATQLVQLDPDDPVATRILQGLEGVRQARSETSEETPKRQVVWF